MRALLFANQPGHGLLPLTEDTCVTLLPVLGKPLIVHALEALADAGIDEILVVVSPHAERVEAELGREDALVGLLGPAHAHGDSEEEKLLLEALFAHGEARSTQRSPAQVRAHQPPALVPEEGHADEAVAQPGCVRGASEADR
jgi:NDP-sugar pyrophosphorylase family protein